MSDNVTNPKTSMEEKAFLRSVTKRERFRAKYKAVKCKKLIEENKGMKGWRQETNGRGEEMLKSGAPASAERKGGG